MTFEMWFGGMIQHSFRKAIENKYRIENNHLELRKLVI